VSYQPDHVSSAFSPFVLLRPMLLLLLLMPLLSFPNQRWRISQEINFHLKKSPKKSGKHKNLWPEIGSELNSLDGYATKWQ